jgi:tripartite-type tricarboxylate transporter receptor subunit TctC
MGAEAVSSTPEQLGDFVRAEIARWAEAARASGADRDLN